MDWFVRYQPLTLSVGMLCALVAMLLWQSPLEGTVVEFATGGLVGLSIVLNGAAIVGATAIRRA